MLKSNAFLLYETKCLIVFIFCTITIIFQNDLCNGMDNKDANNEKTIIIKKQDSGKELKIKCGDVVQIELKGLGSAGYWWYVDKLNLKYLEFLSEETRAISEGKIGAPVLGIWRFKAHGKGYVEIKMDYYRKWEGIEKAVEHFLIKLSID